MNVRKAIDLVTCSLGLAVVGFVCLSANHAQAAATHYYLDVNGTTTGSGVTDGGSYSWENAIWDATPAGTGTSVNWPADGNGFPQFAAGTDANNKGYTITASASHAFAGMALQTSGGGNGGKLVTIAGAPGVVLSLFSNSGGQGIFVGGTSDQNLIISAAIGGDASTPLVWQGLLSGTAAGILSLYGSNTFSGGLDLNTGGSLNFNNANSFGTGPIRWGFTGGTATSFVVAAPAAAAPITIPNPMQTKSASSLTMVSFAQPVTWSGPWSLATGTSTVAVQSGVDTTISGIISGTDSTSALVKATGGKLTISGTNTYAGGTTISGGTLEVSGASANLGTGNVFVSGIGTSLAIDSGVTNALPDAATVSVSGFANMNLGGGVNDRVSTLILDGAQQPNGTYGSSQSGAVNKLDIYFSGTGIITVGPPILAGDFNNNGVVDAADYVAWRNSVGQPSQTLPNDTTGVIVGDAQYNLWRGNFGNTVPAPGAGSSLDRAAVPEPSTLALFVFGFMAVLAVKRSGN